MDNRLRIPYFYRVDSMGFNVAFSLGFQRAIPLVLSVFICASVRAQVRFAPPLPGPWSLSGTFGELRNNHFHAGLDFKTGGREGLPVLAAADGCLSRIRQGPGGYGLALYLDHGTSFTSVYAHLHHAEGEIGSFLDSLQWANRKFEIDTALLKGRFCFRKGDLVGFSGNTGSSDGPHLHFEIRHQQTQDPLNPLSYIPLPGDTVPPVIQKVALYRRTGNRFVRENVVDCSSEHGDTIRLRTYSLECALGLAVNDPERLGIYSIEWSVDGVRLGGFRFERFSFDETRYVNAHTDLFQKSDGSKVRFHRLFRLPGDSCSLFRSTGDCLLDFKKDTTSKLVGIVVSDAKGNRDSLFVRLELVPGSLNEDFPNSRNGLLVLPFRQAQNLSIPGGGNLSLNPRALYQDEYVSTGIQQEKKGDLQYHPVLPGQQISFHEQQLLSLPVPDQFSRSGSKLVTIRCDSAGGRVKEVFMPHGREGRFAIVKIRSGGWYALNEDRTPPSIDGISQHTDPVDGLVYSDCLIRDDLSGIDRYDVFRNHKWVLAGYDAKSGKLRWKTGQADQNPDLISIVLEDKCGNKVRFDTVEMEP